MSRLESGLGFSQDTKSSRHPEEGRACLLAGVVRESFLEEKEPGQQLASCGVGKNILGGSGGMERAKTPTEKLSKWQCLYEGLGGCTKTLSLWRVSPAKTRSRGLRARVQGAVASQRSGATSLIGL